jgi:hypothetical protein
MVSQREEASERALSITRCIKFDETTNRMLVQLVDGPISAFIRALVAQEYGRRQMREEMTREVGNA